MPPRCLRHKDVTFRCHESGAASCVNPTSVELVAQRLCPSRRYRVRRFHHDLQCSRTDTETPAWRAGEATPSVHRHGTSRGVGGMD